MIRKQLLPAAAAVAPRLTTATTMFTDCSATGVITFDWAETLTIA